VAAVWVRARASGEFPRRAGGAGRVAGRRGARLTVLSVASPVIAFPLALGITDPPLIALICLTLACVSRGWLVRAGIAIAAACAMKYTAWPVVPLPPPFLCVPHPPPTSRPFPP